MTMEALTIQNLRKTYRNGFVALKGIDLTVAAGDFFALLGPNGAGKSTTIGIISSLVRKSEGIVKVFGHDLDRDPDSAKQLLGIVPQEVNFNQFETVFNVVFNQAGYQGIPRGKAAERAERCLEMLGLWEKRNEVSRTLSGGMKRRLMIARALVHQPRLLILDEPTAGVDVENRRSMWTLLREINQAGTTIILTTHYLEEAEHLCRNIAIIHQGVIIENAPMGELLSRLQVTHYIFDLEAPIEGVPMVEGATITLLDTMTLSVEIPGTLGLHALFDQLSHAGIRVHSLRSASNRLEQWFLSLTERPGA